MKLSLIIPAAEAVHTFHTGRDEIIVGGEDAEVSIVGTPLDLRKLADKILAAAERRDPTEVDADMSIVEAARLVAQHPYGEDPHWQACIALNIAVGKAAGRSLTSVPS